jgi:hypothetical protein
VKLVHESFCLWNSLSYTLVVDSWFWRFIEGGVHAWGCCPSFAWVMSTCCMFFINTFNCWSFMFTFSMCSSETLFPGNEVSGIYHEIANKVMLVFLWIWLNNHACKLLVFFYLTTNCRV